MERDAEQNPAKKARRRWRLYTAVFAMPAESDIDESLAQNRRHVDINILADVFA
jgi:hypothetical protein